MKLSLALMFFVFCFAVLSADAQTVSGSIGNGTIARGAAARGRVVLTIPGGLHVNSSRPSTEYLIPTVVTVRGPKGVRVSGVTYPRGKNQKFQFSENPINIYDGRVNFPFTVTVPSSFRGNSISLNVAVRYQACTDEVCYPPRTKNVVLTARIG